MTKLGLLASNFACHFQYKSIIVIIIIIIITILFIIIMLIINIIIIMLNIIVIDHTNWRPCMVTKKAITAGLMPGTPSNRQSLKPSVGGLPSPSMKVSLSNCLLRSYLNDRNRAR